MIEVSALAASTVVEVLMLMEAVLVVVVVIGSLFWKALLVVTAAVVRRKRFEWVLKLGLRRKARAAGQVTERSGSSKQDLYRFQFKTIVEKISFCDSLLLDLERNRVLKCSSGTHI